jgi:arsenate reductase
VITIGAALHAEIQAAAQPKLEQWDDVPPADINYAATRDSLKAHIKKLIEQLGNR